MKVLSLCDGIACGRIALERAGIQVDKYYASEIKDIAIKVAMSNYPDIIQIGDVNKISYQNGILYTETGDFNVDHFDLVIFGSPCQSFSNAMRTEYRIGMEDRERSGLFLECYRVLKEVNPTYFLMENVASMRNDDKDVISYLLGVQPILLDSAKVTGCLRKRYYWTNIPITTTLEDRHINLQDLLSFGYTNREKGYCLLASDCRPMTCPIKMFFRYYIRHFTNLIFKSKEHFEACVHKLETKYKGVSARDLPVNDTDIFEGVRYLRQEELERCQTLPEGYTKVLTRDDAANVIGDGWTVEIISYIFKHLTK